MKILIVEDEPELSASILHYLVSQQYDCETASTFAGALHKIDHHEYDCILLDLQLPGGDGMRILEELKSQHKTDGVIIISARHAIEDKIEGLQKGADDYLAKPFHLSELAARIFSVIRRKQFSSSNLLRQNEVLIDIPAKRVTVHGREVQLTRKEFDLLLYLVGNKNRVVSKSALAEHLSGDVADMFDNYDFVYAHIKNLKKKLHDAGYGNYLRTIYGSGYKWDI